MWCFYCFFLAFIMYTMEGVLNCIPLMKHLQRTINCKGIKEKRISNASASHRVFLKYKEYKCSCKYTFWIIIKWVTSVGLHSQIYNGDKKSVHANESSSSFYNMGITLFLSTKNQFIKFKLSCATHSISVMHGRV